MINMICALILLCILVAELGLHLYLNGFEAKWLIERAVDFFGPVLGAIFILWQFSNQHKSNQELQKEEAKHSINLEIYKEIYQQAHKASSTAIALDSLLNNIHMQMENRLNLVKLNADRNIDVRPADLINAYKDVSDATTKLLYLFESYRVAYPRIDLFQIATNVCTENLRNSWIEYFSKTMKFLPFDTNMEEKMIERKISPLRTPALAEQITITKKLGKPVQDACWDISNFSGDLIVDAQNILLGYIFKVAATRRNPLDKRVLVLSTESPSYENLKKFLLEETSYGKKGSQIESEIREELKRNGHLNETGTPSNFGTLPYSDSLPMYSWFQRLRLRVWTR